MILVLEVPHQGKPRCWFAFDHDDFIGKVAGQLSGNIDGVIYHCATARELQNQCRATSTTDDQEQAAIQVLAHAHGWDTPLYRADYLLAPGIYQPDEVSEFMAHVAALAHTVKLCRLYPDEEIAISELEQDPLFSGHDGFDAHMALRDQLIALEALADDL